MKKNKTPKRKLDQPTKLIPGDLTNLAESGISKATARANGIYSCTDTANVAELLNRRDIGLKGLVFPYTRLDGSRDGFVRIRPHNPRQLEGKEIKYEQPIDSELRAYFPDASLPLLNDGESPILITEGEKKALALSQLGFAAIGLGGIWSYAKPKSKPDEFIADLVELRWADRDVYIVFDTDEKSTTRDQVDLAANKLASMLWWQGVHTVFRILLPTSEDGCKQGVDDFLVAEGAEAFKSLVENAEVVPDDSGISSISFISSTPILGRQAYIGPIGDFLDDVSPHTEATDVGILAHLLPAIGAMIGPKPHAQAGSEQPCRLNTALVGPTSTGRKGTSYVPVKQLIKAIDQDFYESQCVSGLSSGEGLINKVADKKERGEDIDSNEIVDKRVLVVESEFSRVLAQTKRDGNILSQVLRESFDSGDLGVLTRDPLSAKDAHICIVGHITPEDLKLKLNEVEKANGFGNRFLWFVVHSDKHMPFAEMVPERIINQHAKVFAKVLRFATPVSHVKLDDDAKGHWEQLYAELRKDLPGFVGAMTARGSTMVLRIALIYALTQHSKQIRVVDIDAAMAVWKYNLESVEMLFGKVSCNSLDDKLYRLLGNGPLKTREFHSHVKATGAEILAGLERLEQSGEIERSINRGTRGRPSTTWSRSTRRNN